MEVPPHPMRLGETERDYYRLGSAGVTAPRDADDAGAGPGPAWTPGAQAPDDQAPDAEAAEAEAADAQAPGAPDADPSGADQ
jgi:NADH-quinone oxidoreductase subunit I